MEEEADHAPLDPAAEPPALPTPQPANHFVFQGEHVPKAKLEEQGPIAGGCVQRGFFC